MLEKLTYKQWFRGWDKVDYRYLALVYAQRSSESGVRFNTQHLALVLKIRHELETKK